MERYLKLQQDFAGTYHLGVFEGPKFLEIIRFSVTLAQAAKIAAKMKMELH